MTEFLGPLFSLLNQVGIFINTQESLKYKNRVAELQTQYEEQMAKTDKVEADGTVKEENKRDDALVVSIHRELLDICNVYSSQLTGSTVQNKPASTQN